MPDWIHLLQPRHCRELGVGSVTAHMSGAPGSTQHQSRGRALILMTQTQHPCCSCSLTPFCTHTLIYMCILPSGYLIPTRSFTPLPLFHTLFHTLFFPSLPPLPSLLSSSPVTTPSVMIHIMNHRHIFEGFSPRLPLSLSLSSPFYPSHISLTLPSPPGAAHSALPRSLFKVSDCGKQDLSLLHITESDVLKYKREC